LIVFLDFGLSEYETEEIKKEGKKIVMNVIPIVNGT
jgi:hypothetical protein